MCGSRGCLVEAPVGVIQAVVTQRQVFAAGADFTPLCGHADNDKWSDQTLFICYSCDLDMVGGRKLSNRDILITYPTCNINEKAEFMVWFF